MGNGKKDKGGMANGLWVVFRKFWNGTTGKVVGRENVGFMA